MSWKMLNSFIFADINLYLFFPFLPGLLFPACRKFATRNKPLLTPIYLIVS